MPHRIVVIEDDEPTRYAYERVLISAGYEVVAFADYFSASAAIDLGTGALLLLDLKLPNGTPHGVSVARMVRSKRPDLPVIFVTGYADYAEYADADIGKLHMKPVNLDDLLTDVRSVLGR